MNKNQGEFGKDEDITEDIQEWLIYQTSWPIKGSILVEIWLTKCLASWFLWKSFWLGGWIDILIKWQT